MSVFVEVTKQGSFAAAARSLGISTTSVSRQVIELEAWLGVPLLRRTTRKLSLTEEGAHHLNECQAVIEDVERIHNHANDSLMQPTGTLKVTAPVFLAKECIRQLLPGFLIAHPEVTVELSAVDRMVDLVDEGFDVAIRIGDLPDSSLVARGLGYAPLVVIGSPHYLATNGTPKTPTELGKYNCIVDTVASFNNRWPMKQHGKRRSVAVSGNVTVNNGEIARDLARQGVGLALLPRFFVIDQLENGELTEVLKGKVDSKIGVYIVYPNNRHLSPKVRAFIDFVVEYFDHLKLKL